MVYTDFRRFPVWQRALEMLVTIYQISAEFPNEERFGLTSDMRRAANSITHNIAEGYGRYESRDKSRFYKISRGSAYELISQISVAVQLGFLRIDHKAVIDNYLSIISELDKLIKTVETR